MLELTHDGEPRSEVAERCCFCRKPTRFWFAPKDVAVCSSCAVEALPDAVPSKAEWCSKERIMSAIRG